MTGVRSAATISSSPPTWLGPITSTGAVTPASRNATPSSTRLTANPSAARAAVNARATAIAPWP